MDVKAQFEEAAVRSKDLPTQSNEILLELYGLYKQATKGDVSGSRPGVFDMVGRAKFDAWSKLSGMSTDDAMTTYISRIDELHSD